MGRLNYSDAPQYQVPTAPNTTSDNTVASTKFVKSVGITRTVLASLPVSDVGLIFVDDMNSIWKWVSTAYYTGYRSLDCGGLILGTTLAPLPGTVSLVGGTALKASYPYTWAFFQEQGLTIANASWVAGTFIAGDIDASNFRWPDMRNMHLRFTGTNADTANPRVLGSNQVDTIIQHSHIMAVYQGGNSGVAAAQSYLNGVGATPPSGTIGSVTAPGGGGLPGGNETRGINTAVCPYLRV